MINRLVCAVVLLIAACGGNNRRYPTDTLGDGTVAIDHAALHPVGLAGSVIADDPILGDPRHLLVTGRQLWISDHAADPYLHVIGTDSGPVLSSLARHGEGPGDFGEVPQLSSRPGDTTGVWAYDATLRRITRESLDSLGSHHVLPVPSAEGLVWSYAWLTHDRLVGIGDTDTNRIFFASATGMVQRVVRAPLLGPDSVSLEARRSISSAYAYCIAPSGAHLAIAYQGGGQVDLFDSAGAFLGHAAAPFASQGDWALSKTQGIWFRYDWIYYLDCAATDRYVYTLFAGHRTDGPSGTRERAARHVHVFDWKGSLVAVLRLDHEASSLAVSGDSLLFAVGQSGDGVRRYSVASLLFTTPRSGAAKSHVADTTR